MEKTGEKTISQWMGIFNELYEAADSQRQPEQIWIAVMAHSSCIGESIRRFSFDTLMYSAAHYFCWLCSFINRCNRMPTDVFSLNECLSGIVSLKYPLACGHCRQNPCCCDAATMDKIANKSAHYELLAAKRAGMILSAKEYPMRLWLEAYKSIYGGRVHIVTLESIGFHFLEEVGEAAVAVRQLSQLRTLADAGIEGINTSLLDELKTVDEIVKHYQGHPKPKADPKDIYTSHDPEVLKWRLISAKMDMIVEIGDTFSWFCAILNKLEEIAGTIYEPPNQLRHPTIEKVLLSEYITASGKARCPTCQNNPCSCAFFPLTQ
jgi:hypothetical protein